MRQRDGSRFVEAGEVLALAYRDSEGDFLHRFKRPAKLLTNAKGDLLLIHGHFNFTRKRGIIDRKR